MYESLVEVSHLQYHLEAIHIRRLKASSILAKEISDYFKTHDFAQVSLEWCNPNFANLVWALKTSAAKTLLTLGPSSYNVEESVASVVSKIIEDKERHYQSSKKR